ncbi:MAG: DinB family protein [Planctomycetota bacterium]
MFSPQSIVYAWDNGLRYALALLEDLTDDQMLLRPGDNMNHPAWILGHMSLYYPIVPALLAGDSFPDPADDDLFGFRGRGPQDDLHLYGSKASQIERMTDGHERVARALLDASPEDFHRPPSLPRWSAMYPTVQFMLPDLLLLHENIHIGQLSIWRRAAGLSAVEFPDRTPREGLI